MSVKTLTILVTVLALVAGMAVGWIARDQKWFMHSASTRLSDGGPGAVPVSDAEFDELLRQQGVSP